MESVQSIITNTTNETQENMDNLQMFLYNRWLRSVGITYVPFQIDYLYAIRIMEAAHLCVLDPHTTYRLEIIHHCESLFVNRIHDMNNASSEMKLAIILYVHCYSYSYTNESDLEVYIKSIDIIPVENTHMFPSLD